MSDATGRIAIARAGSFIDSQGRPQRFSEADLDAIATSYNPRNREAPLVFGHPAVSDPAFGWVKSVHREGKKLFAQIAQIPDEVRKLVQDGRYRYVSMSLMPDRKTLRHVGLLGAAVPAIDGLGPVSLSGDNDAITINFSTGGDMPTIEELQSRVTALEAERDDLKGKLEASSAVAAKTASDFAAYKNGIEVKAREGRIDSLIKDGKVKPAERARCLNFAAMLAESGGTLDFAAADGTVEKLSAEEAYFRELEAREASRLNVDFSEQVPPAHALVRTDAPAVQPSEIIGKL